MRKFTIEELREVEERGRDLAIELQIKGFSDDISKKVDRWGYALDLAKHEIVKELTEITIYDKSRLYTEVSYGLSQLIKLIFRTLTGCSRTPSVAGLNGYGEDPISYIHNGMCYIKDDKVDFDNIWLINEASKEMVDERCATTCISFIEGGDHCSVSLLINDATQCYHRLLEEYEKFRKVEKQKIGKCIIEKGTTADMIEACVRWDEATKKFNSNNLYEPGDYEALHANLFGNKGEFRVGDAAGHRTHLDLDKGTVEYYDDDTSVNMTMKLLFERRGVKCTQRDGGVSCEGLTCQNVKEVAEILAGATTMDHRMVMPVTDSEPNPVSYWKPLLDKITDLEKCDIYEIGMPEFEACCVDKKIKNEWENEWRTIYHPKLIGI